MRNRNDVFTGTASALRAWMALLPSLPSLEYECVRHTQVTLVVARFDFTSATLNTGCAVLVALGARIALDTFSSNKPGPLLAAFTLRLVCGTRSNRIISRQTLARWRRCVAAVLRAATWFALRKDIGTSSRPTNGCQRYGLKAYLHLYLHFACRALNTFRSFVIADAACRTIFTDPILEFCAFLAKDTLWLVIASALPHMPRTTFTSTTGIVVLGICAAAWLANWTAESETAVFAWCA